jgi:hypothetical protein
VRYLQELGFRTFGAVIDESYDDIECPKKRCDAILIEVERICNNNLISSNIAYFAEVCEHNYQQMSKLQPYYTKILEKAIGKFFINT